MVSDQNTKLKNVNGSEAFNENNLVSKAIVAIKNKYKKSIGIMCDVALDPYTSHGHEGLIKKKEQTQKLVYVFAGLYQKAVDKRRRQYSGIIKFVDRQESLRKAIGSASKQIRKLRKEKVNQKDKRYVDASSQLEWNTKVFDQRTKLTEFICEEPVFNTQRLGYQSRKIMSYLK